MRTVRAMAVIPVTALLLVACSNDKATQPTTLAVGGKQLQGDTPPTLGGSPAGSSTSNAGSIPAEPAVDGPLQIDVLVGTNSSPNRIERVKAGNEVTLNLTNQTAADSYHVHGYDLEQKVAKGVTATIIFKAAKKGRFEVESHITNKVLVVMEVS